MAYLSLLILFLLSIFQEEIAPTTCSYPLTWLPIWLWSGCFIHCHILNKNLFFVALKQLQTTLWIINVLSKTTHRRFSVLFLIDCELSFLIDKCSCKMVNTLPSDIFNYSAMSYNFNLWLAKTSLWSDLLFSETTDDFRWPENSASFVSVWLGLKLAYHLLTVVSDRAEPK